MRIGKFEFRWPVLREAVSPLEADTAQGILHRKKNPVYKPKEIASYFDAYTEDDLIRAMVDDLAEAVAGNGFYTTVESLIAKEKEKEELEEGRKSGGQTAKETIDHFNQYFDLDQLFPNISRLTIIAGYCPVQTIIVPNDIEKCALKIIHPKTVAEIETNPQTNEIISITQQVGNEKKDIPGKELAWFTYGQLGNDVRGVSYVRGCIKLLNTLNSATEDVNDIFDRYLSPVGVWKSKRDTEALKAAAQKREPGQDIFMGNLTDEEMAQEVLKFIQIDPRVPFWDYIIYLDRRLYSYSRANNIWYSIQRSEASAEAIDNIIMRHVSSIQRGFKRSAEKYWYTQIAEVYSLSEVPKLNWGKEPTGVEDIAPSDIITKGLELGFIDQIQFDDIMKQIGIKLKPRTGKPSGSAQVPDEESAKEEEPQDEQPAEAVKPLVEQHPLHGNTWGCPQCGYTLLNPFVSAEFIVCPRCGFEPYPDKEKSKYIEVLKSIIKRYNEEFGEKTEEKDD